MNYTILIPAYNPDENFGLFQDKLKEAGLSVLVVDDGSREESRVYFEKAESLGMTVIHHEVNRGKGGALKTGIKYIKDNLPETDCIVTADCDGQHSIDALLKVMKAAEENPEAMIIGGRFSDMKDVPFRSRLGNGFTRTVFRLCTGLKIRDTQTGLRAFPASLSGKMLELSGERYEFEMNMLLALKEWSMDYIEVPIETIYINNNEGSHYNVWRDSWLIFRQLVKYIGASVISFLFEYVLFLVFCAVFKGMGETRILLSYALSRLLSGGLNYTLNRRVVFRSNAKNTFIKYFLLWLTAGTLGSLGSYLICTVWGLPDIVCKILVDVPLFFMNYFIQREFIFKNRKDR